MSGSLLHNPVRIRTTCLEFNDRLAGVGKLITMQGKNKMKKNKPHYKEIFVLVKCVHCNKLRKIYSMEIKDTPLCDNCYMPMVAIKAGR